MGVVPEGTALTGTVMLLNPVLPVSPVTTKDRVAVAVVWFAETWMFDIWMLDTFPLSMKATDEPSSATASAIEPKFSAHEGIKSGAADTSNGASRGKWSVPLAFAG